MRRRQLAMLLDSLEAIPTPRAGLEQYQTPSEVAATVLFTAFGLGDVQDRVVADLGCGNGLFALGAKKLGAMRVIGIDVDPEAIETARRNASTLDLEVEFCVMDVREFREQVDTVFMNPPFGGQRKHADLPFLETALRSARVVYTFHKAETRDFIERRVKRLGGSIDYSTTYKFPLPHLYAFHRKEVEQVDVDLYRIVRNVG